MNEANTMADILGEAGRFPADPLCPPGYVLQDFPIVVMGHGLVQVGEATHEGKPALWFGRGGSGVLGEVILGERPAANGETLAVVVFEGDVARGIEIIEQSLASLRERHGLPRQDER